VSGVRIAITPSDGTDRRPDRGLTVTATGGTLTEVRASAGGKRVEGTMNQAGTAWHSTWALGVSEHYTVTASGTGPSGAPFMKTASFHTFTPKQTFVTQTVEGYQQTYGVGGRSSSTSTTRSPTAGRSKRRSRSRAPSP
jgi:hypothetical protein